MNKNMKTLDMPGKGDQEAQMDYILGKEKAGQFPLGHIPTDWNQIKSTLEGKGNGQSSS